MKNPALIVLYSVGGLFTLLGFVMLIAAQGQYAAVHAGPGSVAPLESAGFAFEALRIHVSNVIFGGAILAIGVLSLLFALASTAIGRTAKNLAA